MKLSQEEVNWIRAGRFTRLTDHQEVLIYPMGAERYLAQVLSGLHPSRYPIQNEIRAKNVLVIPGYGTSGFLFAKAAAKSVTVFDKDPVTIAWMKAYKRFYHYRQASYPSVGQLLEALTAWYPPLLPMPKGQVKKALLRFLFPKALRRVYLLYLIALVQEALGAKGDFELQLPIEFHVGELNVVLKSKQTFDTVFVPYLLGVKNGIEQEKSLLAFLQDATKLVPQGQVLVTPSRDAKEFYCFGQRYLNLNGYLTLQSIPGLQPYFVQDDSNWFRTQGLAVFGPITPQ
jgi:hypothetical protein